MTHADLRERVVPYSVTVTAGAETVTALDSGIAVPAAVKAAGGGESVDLGQTVARQSYRVWLRYRTDLTTRHRLLWQSDFGDKWLSIASLADLDGERRWLTLECQERA